MANKFYEPGAQRADKVNALFGAIAPRYDLINDLQSFGLHRLWKRRLVHLAAVGPGQRALDLCCGTGDVAFRLAQSSAHITGLDFSEAMLAVANSRFKVQGSKFKAQGSKTNSRNSNRWGERTREPEPRRDSQLASTLAQPEQMVSQDAVSELQVQFLQGDAMKTPFPDAHFDAVTVAYGLRNLSSWEAGLREMWRVTRPGGRLLVLDFGKPDFAPWRALYFAYLRWLVPLFGKIFCGDSALYSYILESLQNYPAQHGLAAWMRDRGCADVRIINLLGGVMTINYGVKQC